MNMKASEVYEGVSKSFRTDSITKYTLTTINTRREAIQRVMTAKLSRLTHKIAVQLHLVAESYTICSSRSRRPVRKLLDTLSYKESRKEAVWRICTLESGARVSAAVFERRAWTCATQFWSSNVGCYPWNWSVNSEGTNRSVLAGEGVSRGIGRNLYWSDALTNEPAVFRSLPLIFLTFRISSSVDVYPYLTIWRRDVSYII
jgi:hypothetical protein